MDYFNDLKKFQIIFLNNRHPPQLELNSSRNPKNGKEDGEALDDDPDVYNFEEDEIRGGHKNNCPNSNLRTVRLANAHDADPVRSGRLEPGRGSR